MPFPGYAPPVYTAPDVIHDPDWEDIDLLEWVYSTSPRNNKILFDLMLQWIYEISVHVKCEKLESDLIQWLCSKLGKVSQIWLFKFALLTGREEIILSVIGQSMLSHTRQMRLNTFLCNNQINVRALIGQSAVGYCAGKPTEKSRVFWILI